MKRNPELIREILMCTEADIPLDFSDQKMATYHHQLMVDAGLLNGIHMSEHQWNIGGLTWAGHELLALIRNEDRWRTILRVIDDLDCYSFEIVKQVAIQHMKI